MAKYVRKFGATSNMVRVFIPDSSSTTGASEVAPPMSQAPFTGRPSTHPLMLDASPKRYVTATWCQPEFAANPSALVHRCQCASFVVWEVCLGVANRKFRHTAPPFSRSLSAQFWLSCGNPAVPVRPLPTIETILFAAISEGFTHASKVMESPLEKSKGLFGPKSGNEK